MLRQIIIFLGCLLLVNEIIAQVAPPSSEKDYEAAYAKRIKQEYLHGVYIPVDLADAFVSINRLAEKKSIAKFKYMTETEAVEKLHFSLGRWISHNWGFYGGSRLSHYLKELGIHHPDDMSRFIMLSYHRNLNKKPLEVKKQLEQIQEKYQLAKEKKINSGTILHEEKRKRPKN